MKTTRILISLLLICLLFTSFDGQVVQAQDLNNPPALAAIGDKSTNEGELRGFTISATDPDADPLTYSAPNLPPGASLDPGTGTFSWTTQLHSGRKLPQCSLRSI